MSYGAKNEAKAPNLMRAHMFGPFRIISQSGEEIEISNQRARAILAMLCLAPGTRIDRDLLCSLLWQGRYKEQARASLRQCLLELKKALSFTASDILETKRAHVRLAPSCVSSDLSDFESQLERGAFEAAASSLAGIGAKPLLEGMAFGDAFDEWLRQRRNEVDRRLETGILSALAALDDRGENAVYMQLITAWRTRNPYAETEAAISRHGDKIRVAVLPFKTLGDLEGHSYFADGLVEELITRLGRIPELLIAGQRSSSQIKTTDLGLPDIATALRVNHLIEGSVQAQGDDLCINLRLIDGQTGFESWADQYRGAIDDIFGLQSKVAAAVARALGETLGISFSTLKAYSMKADKAAYDLYLQGRALTTRALGDEVSGNAIRLLEEALEISPNFAEGWTALAEAHIAEIVFTPCEDRVGQTARMAECAHKAIALEPEQGHAQALLGIYHWTQNDVVAALDYSYEAYRLEPNNPDVIGRLGCSLQYCGYTTKALPFLEAAADQDPVHARNFAMLSMAYLNAGDLGAAVDTAERMVDLGFPPLWCAFAKSVAGDREAAVEQYSKAGPSLKTAIRPPPNQPMSDEALDAYLLLAAKGVCGGVEEDRAAYCQLLDYLHTTYFDPYDLSIVQPAIWMGYPEMVFKTLGVRVTPSNVVSLMSLWGDVEPISRIREHADFMAFAEKIGLVAAWEKHGWPDVLPEPETCADQ